MSYVSSRATIVGEFHFQRRPAATLKMSTFPIEDAYESFGDEFTVMCEWFNEVGYSADIGALDAQFDFEFTTLKE